MSQNEECLAEENNYNKVQFRFARNFDEVKMDDKSGLEGSIINHNQSEEKKEILKVEDSTILTNMYTNSNLKNLNTNPQRKLIKLPEKLKCWHKEEGYLKYFYKCCL